MRALISAALAGLLGIGLTSPASASTRFGVVDGDLVDHLTGLVWQPLEATVGDTLPLDPDAGSWRVASAAELSALMPFPVTTPATISTSSDEFAALSFFSATGAFSGWWNDADGHDPSQPVATYNVAFFSFTAATIPSGFVQWTSNTTLGSYTQAQIDSGDAFCNPHCNEIGLFTVRAVPEPPPAALLAPGLLLLGGLLLRRRPNAAAA